MALTYLAYNRLASAAPVHAGYRNMFILCVMVCPKSFLFSELNVRVKLESTAAKASFVDAGIKIVNPC